MTDVQAQPLQLFGHAWTAITAQAEPRLFFDVGQIMSARCLWLAGRLR